ncbi:MAG: AIM24 family protein [Clostridia bacterium]|nr:AIM24 family protein [Clostridia bacterium]
MYEVRNFLDNDDVRVAQQKGSVRIIEYTKDLSVNPSTCITQYYAAQMNVRKKQALIELNNSSWVTSAGAMQWTLGNVQATTDVKGVGDFLGKALKGSVTKESTVKPKYQGTGLLMLEPTYKHLLIEDVSTWGSGMVLDDGMFLACDANVKYDVVMRSNLSSAVLGNQGLFSLKLSGSGLAVLESPVPREELIEIEIKNDTLKIDGNFAVAWSDTLEFTVERSGKSLLGSAVSAEGFVNVYRGTGKILIAPVLASTGYTTSTLGATYARPTGR